jgi:Lon protease-like protein
MSPEESELFQQVVRGSERVKLFPLPEVTLFPGQGLPLHVFEPRYRSLVEDALATDLVLAVPRLLPGAGETEATGRPVLPSFMGVGVIAEHEKLPDGRYHLLVRGIARARLVRELTRSHLYREARLEVLEEETAGVPADLGAALSSCLLELSRQMGPEASQALGRLNSFREEPWRMADLCAAALLSPPQCQELLGELDVRRRIRRVTEGVAELLLSSRAETEGPLN